MKFNLPFSKLLLTTLVIFITSQASCYADETSETAEIAKPAETVKLPLDAVKDAPLGTLKNPYNSEMKDIVEIGRKKFLSASCNGCHGGTGGGGMCPPLSNEVWVYGSEDDTLFRLIALGSVELTAQTGLSRKARENVVGPMPPHGTIVKSEDDMWKIITFIRSVYRGDPSRNPEKAAAK